MKHHLRIGQSSFDGQTWKCAAKCVSANKTVKLALLWNPHKKDYCGKCDKCDETVTATKIMGK